jgi:hypothetical protein
LSKQSPLTSEKGSTVLLPDPGGAEADDAGAAVADVDPELDATRATMITTPTTSHALPSTIPAIARP